MAAWSWVFFDLIGSKDESRIILAVVVGLVLHAFDVRPAGGVLLRVVWHLGGATGASVGYQSASIFAGALAPIIAIALLERATEGDTNVDLVAIYMTIASAITLVAAFFAPRPGASACRATIGCSRTDRLIGRRLVVVSGGRRTVVRPDPDNGARQRVSATGTRVTPPRAPSQTSSPSSRRPGVVVLARRR